MEPTLQTTPNTEAKTPKSNIKKTLVLLGILVILMGAIGVSIFLIPRGVNYLASVSFSSLFTAKEKISVTTEQKQVISGESVTLTWNGPIHTDGTYTISYPCKDGITVIEYGQTMECEKPLYFTSSNNTFVVSFKTTLSHDTDVPLYLNYKNAGGDVSIIGDTLVTVLALGSSPVPVVTATSTASTTIPTTTTATSSIATSTKPVIVVTQPTPAPAPHPTTPDGTDLVVRVINIGYISNTNIFYPGTQTPSGARPAVRFEVTNTGKRTSGGWSIKAILPSPSTPSYQSNVEPSLATGDRVVLTLGFDAYPQGGDVIISINDNHAVTETNYDNNLITYHVNGTGTTVGSTPTNPSSGRDLAISISSIGFIDTNGQFIATSSVPMNSRAAVKFVVTNASNTASGSWNFGATLPSTTDKTYTSSMQDPLAPGASVELTVSFTNIEKLGNNIVSVTVDPSNLMVESNENNNTVSAIVNAY